MSGLGFMKEWGFGDRTGADRAQGEGNSAVRFPLSDGRIKDFPVPPGSGRRTAFSARLYEDRPTTMTGDWILDECQGGRYQRLQIVCSRDSATRSMASNRG